jgi:hypothetical protein
LGARPLLPPFPKGSLKSLAAGLGLRPPITGTGILNALGPPVTATNSVSAGASGDTGKLTFDATVALSYNGSYSVTFQARSNGMINGYDYQVNAVATTNGGVKLVACQSGSLGASLGPPVGGGQSTDNQSPQTGTHAWITAQWGDIQGGLTLDISETAHANGILGFFNGFVEDILKALAVGAVVGPAFGLVVFLGEESFKAVGVAGTISIMAGLAAFAFADASGFGFVLALVAGVAAGAVTLGDIQQRQISKEEYDFANNVFQGTLPPMDQIVLTSLYGLSGRAFTMPGLDGKIYVNLGPAYFNPLTYTNDGYPRNGELLIHELTHAWQILHRTFTPGLICDAIVAYTQKTVLGQNPYSYGAPDVPWASYNPEAQGAIVDQWFGGIATGTDPANVGSRSSTQPKTVPVLPHDDPTDPNFAGGASDPYFQYIVNNIRAGNAGIEGQF